MRKGLSVLAIIILLILSFGGGYKVRQANLEETAIREVKHHILTDLRGCIYAMDSAAIRFVLKSTPERIWKLQWRSGQCISFIESLGTNTIDEEINGLMGEALLFYDGYYKNISKLAAIELILQEDKKNPMYSEEDLEELKAQQFDLIYELEKFVEGLEEIIVRAW